MRSARCIRSRTRLALVAIATLATFGTALAPAARASSPPYVPPFPTTLVAPDPIPVDGYGVTGLAPVATALRDFMRHRCVGAITVGVAYQGNPIAEWGLGRTNGRATLSPLDPACGDDSTDPYDPTASNVDHRDTLRIGSVSKTMSAATFRWALKKQYQDVTGEELTDAALEAMPILGDDFPGGLLPQALHNVLAGVTPLPDPIVECETLDGVADPRWADVTVGHLLGHRAGLPRSAPDLETKVIPNLPLLRGIESEAEFAAEDVATGQGAPAGDVQDARSTLAGEEPGDVFFMRPPTLIEWLTVAAGRCLDVGGDSSAEDSSVGDYHYSNTDPAFWTVIMEHVTGTPFASAAGDPGGHAGTLLHQFFAEQVGLKSSPGSGVFRNPASIAGSEPAVITPRAWSTTQQTFLPMSPDTKRPHCRFVDGICSFDQWVDGTRANWDWETAQVPFDRASVGLGAATGELQISPRFMLQFMGKFWAGGYSADPRIGEPRNDVWNSSASHTGGMTGAKAIAISYSGNSDASFHVPAVDENGRISDDFDHLVAGEFRPPAGLDVFVAMNQSVDPKCRASEQLIDDTEGDGTGVLSPSASHYTCGDAYGLFDDFLLYGLAQVDWDAVVAAMNAPHEKNPHVAGTDWTP